LIITPTSHAHHDLISICLKHYQGICFAHEGIHQDRDGFLEVHVPSFILTHDFYKQFFSQVYKIAYRHRKSLLKIAAVAHPVDSVSIVQPSIDFVDMLKVTVDTMYQEFTLKYDATCPHIVTAVSSPSSSHKFYQAIQAPQIQHVFRKAKAKRLLFHLIKGDETLPQKTSWSTQPIVSFLRIEDLYEEI
jgi:hypothetical protein